MKLMNVGVTYAHLSLGAIPALYSNVPAAPRTVPPCHLLSE